MDPCVDLDFPVGTLLSVYAKSNHLDIKGMTEDGVRPLMEVFLLMEVPVLVSWWSGGINKWRLPSYPYPQATRLDSTLSQLESRVQLVGYHVPIGKFLP